MAPSPSPEHLGEADGQLLLDLAEWSIHTALRPSGADRAAPPAPPTPPDHLHAPHGAFVTLTVDGRLNGCIGAIETPEPLPACIARLARAAAFDDPRLPPLRREDLPALAIEVSILSPLEPIEAGSRAEVLGSVEPHVHGLQIEAERRRGVFLPDVWAQLPDPDDFLDHLLAKAGLHPRTWPAGLRAHRFATTAFVRAPRPDAALTARARPHGSTPGPGAPPDPRPAPRAGGRRG
jgi:AmmeMemoRadiSam system protein A